MKRPKRLTRQHKEALSANNLNHHDYWYVGETEFYFNFIHKKKEHHKKR